MVDTKLTRRTFLKTSGALGALAAAGGCAAATDQLFGDGVAVAVANTEEKTTWGALRHQLSWPMCSEDAREG